MCLDVFDLKCNNSLERGEPTTSLPWKRAGWLLASRLKRLTIQQTCLRSSVGWFPSPTHHGNGTARIVPPASLNHVQQAVWACPPSSTPAIPAALPRFQGGAPRSLSSSWDDDVDPPSCSRLFPLAAPPLAGSPPTLLRPVLLSLPPLACVLFSASALRLRLLHRRGVRLVSPAQFANWR